MTQGPSPSSNAGLNGESDGFPFEGELIVILPEESDLLSACRTVREFIDKHGPLDVTPENEEALALLTGLHDQEAEAWRVLREIPMERIREHQDNVREVVRAAEAVLAAWQDGSNPDVSGWDRHGTFKALRTRLEMLDASRGR